MVCMLPARRSPRVRTLPSPVQGQGFVISAGESDLQVYHHGEIRGTIDVLSGETFGDTECEYANGRGATASLLRLDAGFSRSINGIMLRNVKWCGLFQCV